MSPLVCPGWARAKRITAVPPAEAPRTKYTLDFQVVEQLDQRLRLVGRSSSASDIVATSSRSFRRARRSFPSRRRGSPSPPSPLVRSCLGGRLLQYWCDLQCQGQRSWGPSGRGLLRAGVGDGLRDDRPQHMAVLLILLNSPQQRCRQCGQKRGHCGGKGGRSQRVGSQELSQPVVVAAAAARGHGHGRQPIAQRFPALHAAMLVADSQFLSLRVPPQPDPGSRLHMDAPTLSTERKVVGPADGRCITGSVSGRQQQRSPLF